jgi:hypothetical protein
MTTGMRRGIAALCVAGIAGLVALLVSADDSAAANGIFSAAMLVVAVAGFAGLGLILAATMRSR